MRAFLNCVRPLLCCMSFFAGARAVHAETFKHQVTGLFAPDREADLREVADDLTAIKLVSIDFKNAEAVFEYDPKKAFPGAKPEQIVERFDAMLRGVSRQTFGIKKASNLAPEKLTLIEIPVAGLDCKACGLAAYESIYKLPGVERATASFRQGLVTATIDETRTDRAILEAALKKRGVALK